MLVENRSKPQIAELEMLLTEPTQKDEMIQKQNEEAMRDLALRGPQGGLLVPLPPRRPKGPPAGGPEDAA